MKKKKKMNRCIFFIIFPVTGTNEKKINERKKIYFFVLQNEFGLLTNCIVKKKMYCKAGIVLQ